MSNKYKHGDRVPTKILADRLDYLSDAVTKGKEFINREFVMRIPAELDHCPDLVMSQAAKRLLEYKAEIDTLKDALDTISSGFADNKLELENYAELKLIESEKKAIS